MLDGPKKTNGPYRWGQNRELYAKLVRQKMLAEDIFPNICDAKTAWLLPPDATGRQKVIAWTQAKQPAYIFIANFDIAEEQAVTFSVPVSGAWEFCFSTEREERPDMSVQTGKILVEQLLPGEGLVLKRTNRPTSGKNLIL
jgi:hypothetical protein